MVERVNENLILMNLEMLYMDNIREIMRNWMPDLKQVRSYCKVWAYRSILPPIEYEKELWEGIECLNINLEQKELKGAKIRAIKEADPSIPTICLLEPYREVS